MYVGRMRLEAFFFFIEYDVLFESLLIWTQNIH